MIGRVWQVPLDHPMVPEQGTISMFDFILGLNGDTCNALVSVRDLVAHGADPGPDTPDDTASVRCTRLPHADGPHCSHGSDMATIWGGE